MAVINFTHTAGHAAPNHRWWISKWVDYSGKYGFAYQYANGALGVLFKDGETLLLAANGM